MQFTSRLAAVTLYLVLSLGVCSAQEDADSDTDVLPGVQGTFSASLNETLFPIIPFSFAADIDNYVTDWNVAVQWASRHLDLSRYGPSPPRGFALMHLAQWQALRLNSNETYPLDQNCLVAAVSHLLYSNVYPTYSDEADALFEAQAANFTEVEEDACRDFAAPVVANLLAARRDDGSNLPATFKPPPPNSPPGIFQAVPTGPDVFSNYANGTTFLINASMVEVYVNDTGPPAVGTPEYDANYAGYASYGRANTSETIRSPYQTGSAFFWYGTNGTSGSQGQWNQIALTILPANLSLMETAETLAQLNVASWDMYILIAKSQYKFLRWRPITAVRLGDCYAVASNGCHEPDPTFTSLLVTPNQPTYPSHPGGYAGVGEGILSSWLEPRTNFSIGSEAIVPSLVRPPRVRQYQSVTQAAREVCASRIYGGIEAPNDALTGREYGLQVAEVIQDVFELLDPLAEDVLEPYASLKNTYNLRKS